MLCRAKPISLNDISEKYKFVNQPTNNMLTWNKTPVHNMLT